MFSNPTNKANVFRIYLRSTFNREQLNDFKGNGCWLLETHNKFEEHIKRPIAYFQNLPVKYYKNETIEELNSSILNNKDYKGPKMSLMLIKFKVMLHLRAFMISKLIGYKNIFTLDNGKVNFNKSGAHYDIKSGCVDKDKKLKRLFNKHYKKKMPNNYEGVVKDNLKKATDKYYRILIILKKLNIFDEQRKKIISWCFDKNYFSAWIQNKIIKFNKRAKTQYKFMLRLPPMEQLEFVKTFMTGVNKKTGQYYEMRQLYSGGGGANRQYAYAPIIFKFKTLTERSVKNLFKFDYNWDNNLINPHPQLNEAIKKATKNPYIIGFENADGERFGTNMEQNKKVKFDNERLALNFKHRHSKRYQFIYKIFNKYKNILNEPVMLKNWSWDSENEYHKSVKDVPKFKSCFVGNKMNWTITAKKEILFSDKIGSFMPKEVQVPQYCYNNVMDPNMLDDNFQSYEFFQHSKKFNIYRTDATISGDWDQFDEATDKYMWKKDREGKPIIKYWWKGNGYKAIWNKLPTKINDGKLLE